MTELTTDDIDKALSGMMRAFDAEYQSMEQTDLEKRWHYKPNASRTPEQDLYEFLSTLTLYAGSCRRWEEMHNGNSCVVERVRDLYVMPKIRAYVKSLKGLSEQNETGT